MSGLQKALFLCLGLGVSAVVAYNCTSENWARLRAHRVRETTVVSGGGRRLAGFFDGLRWYSSSGTWILTLISGSPAL
jgi:hypothetical protein